MIRGLFRFIFRLVGLALLVFVLTAVYIVYDGLNDRGDTADCGVVLGNAVKTDGQPGAVLRERLDRAVLLYDDHKVPLLIVSGGRNPEGTDEASSMADYLEAHGVPAGAVIQDHNGAHTADTAQSVVNIMRARGLRSVMMISHYYHMTRTRLSLGHAGARRIAQAHVGTATRHDAFTLAREDCALWYYIFRDYLRPAADKATVQAKAEAQVLKEKVQSVEHK